MTGIKRMFTNQNSNEALRQTASARKEKTEYTFHFTHQYCTHSPPTDPRLFCGHREVSHPLVILDLVYTAFKAGSNACPCPTPLLQ